MSEHETDTTPKAWVGCLRCYNEGRLEGAWLPGDEAGDLHTLDHLLPARSGPVDTETGVHVKCGGEEWWVMDFEYAPPTIKGECSPAEFQRHVEWWDEVTDGIDAPDAAIGVWLDNLDLGIEDDPADLASRWEDTYRGEWSDGRHYAMELFEGTATRDVLEAQERWPLNCVDWDHAYRELTIGGDVWDWRDPIEFVLHVWSVD